MAIRFREITTWRDMLNALQACSDKQLDQPVQVAKSHPVPEYVHALQQGIALATVGALELEYARSVTDNRMHNDHLVIFTDGNPFGEEGAIGYEWKRGRGKDRPIFPPGHDDGCNWTGPAQQLADARRKRRPKKRTKPSKVACAIILNRCRRDA